jgi:hypothetical protein
MQTDNNLKALIDIKPRKDFEHGINLNFRINAGSKGKEIIEAMPDYMQTNPLSVSLELCIEDAEKGPEIVQTLEGVLEMAMQMIPNAQDMLSQGILIKFRHVGKSIFIDVSLEGQFAEMVKAQLELFKIDLSLYSECCESHYISGLKLNKPFENSYEELVTMATQFKVQGNGQLPAKQFYEMIKKSITDNFNDHIPKMFKKIIRLARIITAFRKVSYTCDYDSEEMCNYIKELAGKIASNTMGGATMEELNAEMGTQMIGSMLAQGQEMAKMQMEPMKNMAMAFLEPYKASICQLNFDKIGLSLVSPNYCSQIELTLCLVGLTEFVRANLLN